MNTETQNVEMQGTDPFTVKRLKRRIGKNAALQAALQ